MDQIQIALVAIALVLSAVFLPMIFFGGSTGVIYRQFSATIVTAMALSVFVALTLSPALAATLLRRRNAGPPAQSKVGLLMEHARKRFNSAFDTSRDWYVTKGGTSINRKWLFLGIYGLIGAALIAM